MLYPYFVSLFNASLTIKKAMFPSLLSSTSELKRQLKINKNGKNTHTNTKVINHKTLNITLFINILTIIFP